MMMGLQPLNQGETERTEKGLRRLGNNKSADLTASSGIHLGAKSDYLSQVRISNLNC